MNMKIGIIGSGNMGTAILGGIVKSGLVAPGEVIVSNRTQPKLDRVRADYGVNTTLDAKEVVLNSDIVIVAVKPHIYDSVLTEVRELIDSDKIIVNIAAGKTIESIEAVIGDDKKIVRTMPNTPALVGEGMTAICPNRNINEEDLEKAISVFESFGKAEVVSESMIDAVIGASGSSPAYVFMFIEAIADAVVIHGMPRDKAYKFVAQAVLGSAKMVLETGKHPGELKDMVCSPSGTTIEAVRALEEAGMRGAVIKGVNACIEKSIEMSK